MQRVRERDGLALRFPRDVGREIHKRPVGAREQLAGGVYRSFHGDITAALHRPLRHDTVAEPFGAQRARTRRLGNPARSNDDMNVVAVAAATEARDVRDVAVDIHAIRCSHTRVCV